LSPIFIANGRKPQTEAPPVNGVANRGFGAYLPFWHQKMEIGFRANFAGALGFDEHAAHS
jgi:hypothetical protein